MRRSSGELLWQSAQYPALPSLSPDGQRVAGAGAVFTRTGQPASGARLSAPPGSQGMYALGWLDSATIVAAPQYVSPITLFPPHPLFLVDAANPSRVRPLGVSGAFEGALKTN